MWQIIKNNVEKRMPKDINELKKFMVEEWDAISVETVNNLVLSMKKKCELVLEKNRDRIYNKVHYKLSKTSGIV